MILLILLSLSLSSLSEDTGWQMIVHYWLDVKSTSSKPFDPNVPDKHIFTVWPCNDNRDNYIIIRPKDSADSLDVTSFHKNRFNLEDFVYYARMYPGDPNTIKSVPPDPNYPPVMPEVIDPNLLNFVTENMEK